jgi:hypothetical protein
VQENDKKSAKAKKSGNFYYALKAGKMSYKVGTGKQQLLLRKVKAGQ